jgi:D-threo-aldose 1-dehydrogenase
MKRLLPACAELRTAVVVGGVFNSGILADSSATYDYLPARTGVRGRVQKMTEICDRWSVPLKAVALQFPLGHRAVAGVVLGIRTPDELTENLKLLDLAVPPGLWRDLQQVGLLPETAPIPREPGSWARRG